MGPVVQGACCSHSLPPGWATSLAVEFSGSIFSACFATNYSCLAYQKTVPGVFLTFLCALACSAHSSVTGGLTVFCHLLFGDCLTFSFQADAEANAGYNVYSL